MTKKEEQRIKESGKVKRERGGQGSERERHSKRRKGQIFFFPRPNSHKYHPIDNNAKNHLAAGLQPGLPLFYFMLERKSQKIRKSKCGRLFMKN